VLRERTQEFRKNLAKISQVVCDTLPMSAIATDPSREAHLPEWDTQGRRRNSAMNATTTKVSKPRMAAGVLLGTVGLSLMASLTPAVASADPYQPFSGPRHPVRHYLGDIEHPLWAITHPLRALIP
jgi:hypothetical protein